MQNKLLIIIPIFILILVTIPVFAQTDNELNAALEQIWMQLLQHDGMIQDNEHRINNHQAQINGFKVVVPDNTQRINSIENHTNLWINQTLQNDNEIMERIRILEEKQNNISITIKCEGCN